MKVNSLRKLIFILPLTYGLLVASATPVTMPILQPTVTRVTEEHLADYKANPYKRFDTNLIVDPVGQRSKEFLAIASRVSLVSGNLYRGFLNSAEVSNLANVAGIAFERNRPADYLPIKEFKPEFVIPKVIWGTEGTINEIDPDLRAARYTTGIYGTGITVAVLDTGIDTEAVGLSGNKVIHRVDFSTPPESGSCTDNGRLDPYGHGTHVASIIAGADPVFEGVAPGASLIDLRVLNCAGSGYMNQVDEALQWVLDNLETHPVQVVNMSLGTSDGQQDGLESTSILINRLVARGVFVSIAAGNQGAARAKLYSPATAEFAATVAAATVTEYGNFLAPYSSHGPTSDGRAGIDLTAPGSGVKAALSTGVGYHPAAVEIALAGTSMAAPHVAGIAALLLAQHPEYRPTGQVCELSETCPSGVVKGSMTNQVLANMRTSDWFDSGIDAASGAGLVSASATLLGQAKPAAASIRAGTDGISDTVLRFPASKQPHVVTLLLDNPWLSNMWDHSQRFTIGQFDPQQNQLTPMAVCSIVGPGTCQFGENAFSPRIYSYFLAPSDQDTFLVIKTNRVTEFSVSVDSYSETITAFSGVSLSPVDFTDGNQGILTVTRTQAATEETTFSFSATGGVTGPASITLPAGGVGTQVQIQLQAPVNPLHGLERAVLTTANGIPLVVEVNLPRDNFGRIIYPNPLKYDDWGGADVNLPIFVANDGTFLSQSAGTGMSNGSGYANPYLVPGNSLHAQPLTFSQTSTSQIDSYGLSQDGSAGIFRQFPAGAGIVPGDDDLSFTYFVTKFATGENYRIGPDSAMWSDWLEQLRADTKVAIDYDGQAVAWAVQTPGSEGVWKLGVDFGEQFGQHSILASFPTGTSVQQLVGISHRKVLVSVSVSGSGELRLYDFDGNYTRITAVGQYPRNSALSQSGTAVGFVDITNSVSCWKAGVLTKLLANGSSGDFTDDVRVADDCSWVIANRIVTQRLDNTFYLEKIFSDGSIQTLAKSTESANGWRQWKMSQSASQIITLSPQQLEPGDTNLKSDYYRGLYSSPVTAAAKDFPYLYWAPEQEVLVGTYARLNAETSSTNPVKFEVISGGCFISDNKLWPPYTYEGITNENVCRVRAYTEENSEFFARSKTVTFYVEPPESQLLRIPRYIFDDRTAVSYGETFRPVSWSSTEFSLATTGPCHVEWGVYVTADSGVGTCEVSISSPSTWLYGAKSWVKQFGLARANLPVGKTVAVENQIFEGETTRVDVRLSRPAPYTIAVTGPCRMTGDWLTGTGNGDCYVHVDISETDFTNAYSETLVVKIIGVKKVAQLTLNGGTYTRNKFKAILLTSFTNSNASVSFTVTGPCRIEGSYLLAESRKARCIVKAALNETNEYLSAEVSSVFDLTFGNVWSKFRSVLISHRGMKLFDIESRAE